jgi:hypothetical protein
MFERTRGRGQAVTQSLGITQTINRVSFGIRFLLDFLRETF